MGASGNHGAHVNSAVDCLRILKYAKFAPQGYRGGAVCSRQPLLPCGRRERRARLL
jgi:hypothetical protein